MPESHRNLALGNRNSALMYSIKHMVELFPLKCGIQSYAFLLRKLLLYLQSYYLLHQKKVIY